jgi:Domain of unknown function (DUF6894)
MRVSHIGAPQLAQRGCSISFCFRSKSECVSRKTSMPKYFFHLRDNEPILDTDGTELIGIDAARDHADIVARELMFKSEGILGEAWSEWTMLVHDSDGLELFSFEMSGISRGNGK